MIEDRSENPPAHTVTSKLPWSRPTITMLDEFTETSNGSVDSRYEDPISQRIVEPTS